MNAALRFSVRGALFFAVALVITLSGSAQAASVPTTSVAMQIMATPVIDTSLIGNWTLFPIIQHFYGEGSGSETDLTSQPGIPVTISLSVDGTHLESPGHPLMFPDYVSTLKGIDLVTAIPLKRIGDGFYGSAIETVDSSLGHDITTRVDVNLRVVSADRIDVVEHLAGYESSADTKAVLARGTTDPRLSMLPYAVCLGGPAPHLAAGQIVTVTYSKGLNLRAIPAPNGQKLADIDPGTSVQVLDGPQCGGNMAYWHVTVNGQTGWLSEGAGTTYWLSLPDETVEPAPFAVPAELNGYNTPALNAALYRLNVDGTMVSKGESTGQCANSAPSRLHIGGQGRVLPGDPNSLNTKAAPHSVDPTSQQIALIPTGGVFDVVDGPYCDSNIAWWKVNYLGKVGYTGEMQLTTYWVEPLP